MKLWQILAAGAVVYAVTRGSGGQRGAAAARGRAAASLATMSVVPGGEALRWGGAEFRVQTTVQVQELAEALRESGVRVVRVTGVEAWHADISAAVATLRQEGFTVYV